jgi:hypothetical protein
MPCVCLGRCAAGPNIEWTEYNLAAIELPRILLFIRLILADEVGDCRSFLRAGEENCKPERRVDQQSKGRISFYRERTSALCHVPSTLNRFTALFPTCLTCVDQVSPLSSVTPRYCVVLTHFMACLRNCATMPSKQMYLNYI